MPEDYHPESVERLSMTEDDLLKLLGSDLVGPQALPLRPTELAERGKRWLTAQRENLETQICSSESMRHFALGTTDSSAIAVELAKLLAGLLLPVNPVTLAVLIVKKGLKSFCSTYWGSQ